MSLNTHTRYLLKKGYIYPEYYGKEIKLSGGRKSHYYFDLKSTLLYDYEGMLRVMLIATEKLAYLPHLSLFGIMRGGSALAVRFSHVFRCPCGAIDTRNGDGEIFFRRKEGAVLREKSLVIVDDVVTTLSSVKKARNLLLAEGFISERVKTPVFCIVDRRSDKKRESVFEIFSIINFDEATGELTRG